LRLGALLLGAFGGLALILAIVGLYAVVAYSVSKQTREIGVRIAMGAGRSDIVAMVLKRGARLALVGIVLGVGLSIPFGTLLASLLYGINTTDPVIMLSVGLLMGAIALIASFIPAWKAMRLNPVAALRYE
jgi:ABC-type antimicrobial peptide transport system permease subunit